MSSGASPHATREWRIAPRQPEDWPALLDLWVASWSATYPDIDFDARREWLIGHVEELESSGAACLLLKDAAGRIGGLVVIHPSTGWLDQICVTPDLFGSGAAALLVDAAKGLSPAVIRLDVNVDNARALAFYMRHGFSRTGEGAISKSGRKTMVLEWRAGLVQGDFA